MRTRLALLATPLLLLFACSDIPLAPPELEPAFSAHAPGAPAGAGNCNASALRETVKGRITPGSCLFSEATGSRALRYEMDTPGAGQMVVLSLTAQFAGSYGVKQATENLMDGIFWGALGAPAGVPRAFSFIGSSPQQHAYVHGNDGSEMGAFELGASVQPISWQCGRPVLLEAPVSFGITLDADHSCHVTIQVSPFPDALGEAIHIQTYNVRLTAGQSYRIRIEGVTASFNPALTIWAGNSVVAQSAGPVPTSGVRELIFTPIATRLFLVEVSSGQPDGAGGWATPAGNYTLSVSPL